MKLNKQEFLNLIKEEVKKAIEEINMLDYTKISNIEFDGIDHKDYPDYSDAYIVNADYDGVEMTEEQLDEINDDKDFVHEKLMDYLY